MNAGGLLGPVDDALAIDRQRGSGCSWPQPERSVPMGHYWPTSPLGMSLEPCCHGLCGSQKHTAIPQRWLSALCIAISLPWSQAMRLRSTMGPTALALFAPTMRSPSRRPENCRVSISGARMWMLNLAGPSPRLRRCRAQSRAGELARSPWGVRCAAALDQWRSPQGLGQLLHAEPPLYQSGLRHAVFRLALLVTSG
jgi:hypothetical protein